MKKVLLVFLIIASIVASAFLINTVSRLVTFQEVDLNGIKVDVGSFEDYSSSSSSSSSSSYSGGGYSHSGGSSYSGGGYSRDYDYDSGSGGISGVGLLIVLVIIIIIVAYSRSQNKGQTTKMDKEVIPTYTVGNQNLVMENHDDQVSRQIKEHDPDFDIEEFKSFAKTTFIKLQNAWTERDWEKVRILESDKLFELHKTQLQGYIDKNQINVIERIMVNEAHLYNFTQVKGMDTLTIDLKTRMADYIIDATTKTVLRGDPNRETYHIYRLTFVKTSAKKEFSLSSIELENEVDLKPILGGLTEGFADIKDAVANSRAYMLDDINVGIITTPGSESEVILKNAFKHQENIDKLQELISAKLDKKVLVTLVKFPTEKAGSGETKDGKATKTTNCPNCGAPTEVTSTGRCPYCHSVIVTKQYDWVLDNLERPQ